MAMNDKEYLEVSLKLMPRGLAWRKSLTGTLGQLLGGLSTTWSKIDAEATQALDEMNPQWSEVMLGEWDDLLGLPECGQTGLTLRERQNQAGYKWHLKGSLNPRFYMDWMKQAFDYDIEIVTYHPHHCLRPCNYPLYSEAYDSRADVHVRINSASPYRYFNVQDRVNDPLVIGQQTVIECILNKYKPAHIEFHFHYEVTGGQ